jgi:DNA-binding NtrC family response regulator
MARSSVPTVLVVDDSDGVCAAVSMLLEEAGYAVESASGYTQALRSAAQNAFDLLIIDAQLGFESGIDLAGQVLSRRPESKIIIMSGADLHDSADGLLKLPILQKPFSRQELIECVQRVAEKAA